MLLKPQCLLCSPWIHISLSVADWGSECSVQIGDGASFFSRSICSIKTRKYLMLRELSQRFTDKKIWRVIERSASWATLACRSSLQVQSNDDRRSSSFIDPLDLLAYGGRLPTFDRLKKTEAWRVDAANRCPML